MELVQLKYFRTLAKIENLTQAAAELYISPPSLSVSISNLEKELGVRLFDRVGRRMYLNTNGQAFYNHIDNIFNNLDFAVSEVQRLNNKLDSIVTVGTTSPNVFQNVFMQFLSHYPDYKIFQTTLTLDQIDCESLRHKFDFIIASPDDFAPYKSISSTVLYNNDYAILVVPPTHHLAGLKEINLNLLRDEPFVALTRGTSSRKFFDTICNRAHFTPNIVIECDYSMRFYMIKRNAGITIATAHTKKLGFCDGLFTLRISEPFSPRTQCIYWDKRRSQSKAATAFYDYINNFFKNILFD